MTVVYEKLIRLVGFDPRPTRVAGGKPKLDPRIPELNRSGAALNWLILRDLDHDAPCASELIDRRTSRFDTGGATSSARIDALFDAYAEWRAIEPAPVEVGAGGAVFLSGMVAHAAGPNMTRGRRRAFSILFMPDDAVFNGHQSALPDAVASRLQVGDPIADDEHLPLLYSRRLHRHVNS